MGTLRLNRAFTARGRLNWFDSPWSIVPGRRHRDHIPCPPSPWFL